MAPPKTPDPLFRVVSRLKNNRLVAAREAKGLTLRQAAEAAGVEAQTLSGLETFRLSPVRKRDGTWTPSAVKVATYYGRPPDELWPDEIHAVRRTVSVQMLEAEAVYTLGVGAPPTPHELLEGAEDKEIVRREYEAMHKDYARVIALRVEEGLDFEEMGERLRISASHARTVYYQGLAHLRRRLERRHKMKGP